MMMATKSIQGSTNEQELRILLTEDGYNTCETSSGLHSEGYSHY